MRSPGPRTCRERRSGRRAAALLLVGAAACAAEDPIALVETCTLTILAPDHGKLTGASSGARFPYGAVVDLTVVPEDGHEVKGWTGAAASCGHARRCRIVVEGDLTIGVHIGNRRDGAGSDGDPDRRGD